jgi:hypothetical protein
MEVSDKAHAPAALLIGIKYQTPAVYEDVWAPESVTEVQKYLLHPWESNYGRAIRNG